VDSNSKIIDPLSEALGIECSIEIDYSDCVIFDPVTNREEAIKRNAEIVECDRCGVKGNRPNMIRWHFENCTTKLKKCKQCQNIIPRQGIKDSLYKDKKYCSRSCYMKTKIGKTPIVMTQEVRTKISKSALSRSEQLSVRMKNNISQLEKLTCSNCGKTMNKGNFIKWNHGEQCEQ
jgi:hypothetical protein